jgi:DNA-binding NarL/FixJ family response regulator
MNILISIVEDDRKVRESLAHLINKSPGFRCVSQHASAEIALVEIPKIKPDVILMDINLGAMTGVECVRKLKPVMAGTQIIMLTVYQNTEHIFDALAAGASGYMLKQTKPDELLDAIRDVHSGGSPMSGHIARKVVQSFQQQAPQDETQSLSPREAQVIELLAKGYLYKEVADTMGVTYATIHTHIRHIYEKLHVRSRTEAVVKHLGQSRGSSEASKARPTGPASRAGG